MTIEEFQKKAARTCPSLGTKDADIYHMAMGVFTELGELVDAYKKNFAYGKVLDMINVKEEIGDAYWYTVNWLRINGTNISTKADSFVRIPPGSALNEGSVIPKACMYVSGAITLCISDPASVSQLLATLDTICKSLGFNRELIFRNNINKLIQRFPDKFTEEKALNRNLDKERKELEK